MTKQSIPKIFWISLALLICTYFTRRLFAVPFLGAGICLLVFIAITSVALFIKRQRIGEEYLSAKEVSVFRMFDRMQMFAKIALYIAILCFFNSVLLDEEKSLQNTVIYLCVCFIAITVAMIFIYYTFAKRAAEHFDRTNVFIIGTLIWIISAILTYCKFFEINAVGYIFCCIGIGLIYASLRFIHHDVQEAMELVSNMQDNKFQKFASYSDTKALLIAQIAILAMMIVFSDRSYAPTMFSNAVLLLPGIFLIIACIFACMQPLDEKSFDKMIVYRTAEGDAKEKEIIKNSLAQKLINGKNKIGIRLMILLIRPFFPCKCIGKEKLKDLDGPVVFVGNHYEIYGPVISVLRMPVRFRPWIINEMLDDEKIEKQMSWGINQIKWLPKCIKKRLPKLVKRLMKYVLTAMDPIPVYKGNLREVVTTINMTVETMQQGDNIMLFPENPEKMYSQGGVDKFYSGFVEIGNSYYKKTGKNTTFFPVYISKKKRKIFIGDGIKYDGGMPKADEKRRVANALHDSMEKMANYTNKKED